MKTVHLLFLTSGLGLLLSGSPNQGDSRVILGELIDPDFSEIPWEIERLALAYPLTVSKVDRDTIFFTDGTRLEWRSGGIKLLSLLKTPMTYQELMLEHPTRTFKEDEISDWFDAADPGRLIYYTLLEKMYGSTTEAIVANLRTVNFMPNTLRIRLQFSSVNGAADALDAVSADLEALPTRLRPFLQRSTSYVDRRIAGTQVRSLHALGIAIDINPRFGNYWRWDWELSENDEFIPRNSVPLEIVNIFEKHGFLWGGRWYLYDTLHFEYRPELFLMQPQDANL